MSVKRWLVIGVGISVLQGAAQEGPVWNSPRAGNPLIPGHFADPCSRKFADTYYIYVTPDGWMSAVVRLECGAPRITSIGSGSR